jgi:GT2 family glycosyltransferase
MVISEFPAVNLVWNSRNTGYARACNKGIALAREPYIMVMNSDVVLHPDTVSRLVEFLDRNPRAGVAGPRVLNADGSLQFSCRRFPSMLQSFVHAFMGLFRAENPYSTSYKMMNMDRVRETDVDWVSGAFMMLRRDALSETGRFDEKYFMYVEDVDLCWRMWRAGWTVDYVPEATVVHHIGMSGRLVPTRMVFHHHRSMLRFHRKTYEGPWRLPVQAAVAAGVAVRFLLIVALNLFYRIRALLGGAKRVIMPGRQ